MTIVLFRVNRNKTGLANTKMGIFTFWRDAEQLNENLAKYLKGWDVQYNTPQFIVSGSVPNETGHLKKNDSARRISSNEYKMAAMQHTSWNHYFKYRHLSQTLLFYHYHQTESPRNFRILLAWHSHAAERRLALFHYRRMVSLELERWFIWFCSKLT